jgi:hypothetical protein
MLGGIVIAVLVSAIWIAGQIILRRAIGSNNHFKAMAIGYVVSLLLVYFAWHYFPAVFPGLWAGLVGNEHPTHSLWHAYVGDTLIFFLYAECFYHVERSVTLRLMIEILTFPGGRPTTNEISKHYSLNDMIAERLAVLVAHGYITKSGDRFSLLSKGRRFATGVRLFCWIYRSKTQDERLSG